MSPNTSSHTTNLAIEPSVSSYYDRTSILAELGIINNHRHFPNNSNNVANNNNNNTAILC
ncbi:1100_t:CDS:2 [Entrophospora sp. SA101]|nr:1099_t:CDS:2 [Entrophospora sp. SA101]CAJ0651125.1 1100_t:CDS:2 [Entrophospora sp. SA101]CAJ0879464.1 2903_t:CDS:2 [Entrophospora sp. SA101]CAJ0879476.1 2904_t:CDS:2 [Entrophospora sp. SA101]CAJ0923514.1 10873_t:CDS:2 [Entrophospora sp. SA101]